MPTFKRRSGHPGKTCGHIGEARGSAKVRSGCCGGLGTIWEVREQDWVMEGALCGEGRVLRDSRVSGGGGSHSVELGETGPPFDRHCEAWLGKLRVLEPREMTGAT